MLRFLSAGFYVNEGSIIAIGIIFPVLGILAVSGRFYSRYKSRLGFKTDDWLCVPALACVIGLGVMYIYGAAIHSLGYRLPANETIEEVLSDPSYNEKPELKIEYASNLLCGFSSNIIRLVFLFFYRRIFRGRLFDIVSWFMIALVSLWLLLMTLLLFSICGDKLSAVWTGSVVYMEKCPHMLPFIGGAAIVQFALDVLILAMPFPWIWRLHMPVAQKVAVSSIFLCGIFTVGASATRMVVGVEAIDFKLGHYENIMGLETDDDLIAATSIWLFWGYIEVGTGMTVCCLPALKPLFSGKPERITSSAIKALGSPFSSRQSSKAQSSKASREISGNQSSSAASERTVVGDSVDASDRDEQKQEV